MRTKLKTALSSGYLILLLLLTLYPLWILLVKSFKNDTQDIFHPFSVTFPLAFSNYRKVWKEIGPYVFNSLFIAFTIALLVMVIASYTAYIFEKFKFRAKETLFTAVLSLMMVPSIICLIPQYVLVRDFNLIGRYAGVILPLVAGNISYGTFLMRTFFAGLPKELFEAAQLDGAGRLRMYAVIVLPLSVPILLTLGISAFLGAYNDYLWTLLVLRNSYEKYTITIGLVSLTNAFGSRPINIALAGYVIASIPLMVLFALVSRQFIGGLMSGAVKM